MTLVVPRRKDGPTWGELREQTPQGVDPHDSVPVTKSNEDGTQDINQATCLQQVLDTLFIFQSGHLGAL